MSGRAIEKKCRVGRRTIVKALASAWPEPRRQLGCCGVREGELLTGDGVTQGIVRIGAVWGGTPANVGRIIERAPEACITCRAAGRPMVRFWRIRVDPGRDSGGGRPGR